MTTGLSGAASSRSCRIGGRFSLRLFWFHPEPRIHLFFGLVCAFCLIASWIAWIESECLRSSQLRVLPKSAICMCVSMNPGRMVFPCSSRTLASLLMRGVMSVVLPTLRMRSFFMAMASACGFFRFMVMMLALSRTKSAFIRGSLLWLLCARVHLSLSL